ncbi:zygote arrest protein 1-like [Lampetra fluviatilis]
MRWGKAMNTCKEDRVSALAEPLVPAWQWTPWPLAWKLAQWPGDITTLLEGEVGPCTREVAVQVSPRRDSSVQCDLEGSIHVRPDLRPRPLLGQRPEGKASSPCGIGAICSYVPLRHPQNVIATEGVTRTNSSQPAGSDDITKAQDQGSDVVKAQQAGSDPANAESGGEVESDHVTEGQEKRNYPSFQFLEQKYGYFHCRECGTRWESAFTWCVSGTFKVYFKQLCRKCQKSFNPYRVEDIVCSRCSRPVCVCSSVQGRSFPRAPRRPHRQDLCSRCRGRPLSCVRTFSFKYIL